MGSFRPHICKLFYWVSGKWTGSGKDKLVIRPALRSLGVLAGYVPTIGAKRSDPQTSYSEWLQDFPNPVDFHLLVNANSIQPLGNRNRSYVRDPHIQSALAELDDVPTTKLSSVSTQWSALDHYVAQHADELVFGDGEAPKFLSDRINHATAVFSPISLNDWSSWELKQ